MTQSINQATRGNSARLVELDSLRGLAALAVMFFHLTFWRDKLGTEPFTLMGQHVKFFHYSVELFFITSGFVIFLTLEGVKDTRMFIVSRIARLYPAYWVCCILTTIFAYMMESHPPTWDVVAINMTMTETFFRIPYVDNSYWTLGVEIQFYVLTGIIFALSLLHRIDVLCLGFLTGVLAWQGSLYVFGLPPVMWIEESFLQYGCFFVIGICFYRMRKGDLTRLTRFNLALAVLSTGWGGGHQSLSPGSLEYVAGTVVLSAFMWAAMSNTMRFLRWQPLVFVGELSYPLYLIHQRIGIGLTEGFLRHGFPVPAAVAGGTAIVMGIAIVVHVTVETPGRRFLRRILSGSTAPRVVRVEGAVSV